MRFARLLLPALVVMAGCSKKAGPDLAFTSPDDAVVIHLKVADLMASKVGKSFADMAASQAGGGLEEIAQELGVGLDQVEAVTLSLAGFENKGPQAKPRVLVAFKSDVKPESLSPRATKTKVEVAGFKEAYSSGDDLMLVVDSRRILFLPDQAASAGSVKFDYPKDGPLAPAIKSASGGKSHMVVGINPTKLPTEAAKGPAAQFADIFTKNGRVPLLELTAGDTIDLALSVLATSSDDAEDAGKGMQSSLEQLRVQAKGILPVLSLDPKTGPLVAPLTQGLDGAKVDGSGKSRTLSASFKFDPSAFAGLKNMGGGSSSSAAARPSGSGPMSQGSAPSSGIREAAQRTQAQNNLKQIMLGMHNFEGTFAKFPGFGVPGPAGKSPGLSWRVAILPYVEHGALYKQFKLDEAWDSPSNKALLKQMPKLFVVPGTESAGAEGKTHLRAFTLGKGVGLIDITDGSSNTACVVEAAEAVEWTKPETLDLDAKDLHALIRWGWSGGTASNFAFYDGSVRALKKGMSAKTLHDLLDPKDGNVLNLDN